LNRIPDCAINECGKPHHKMLHKGLEDEGETERLAGDASCRLLEGLGIDPGSVRLSVPEKVAEADLRRELLMGLGIDSVESVRVEEEPGWQVFSQDGGR
jgi:hypothetical protein